MRRPWLVFSCLCLVPGSLFAADAKPLYDSGIVSVGNAAAVKPIEVDVAGKAELYLIVRDGGDGFGCDWATWATPRFVGGHAAKKLTELKWKSATTGFGEVHVNANVAGQPQKLGGKSVEYGLGTHANSVIVYDIPAGTTKFQATVGLDDTGTNQGCGSTVQFLVFADKPPAALLQSGSAPVAVSREPADAVAALDVGEGLAASLMAAEPFLKNPSNIDVDHLGRIWVCEVMNYRRFANKDNPDRPEGDRILVLEDTDANGEVDKQTVFYQGTDVDSAHGVCVLGDRVIISCGDSVFSLYDRDGDLQADAGSKELLFTGIAGTQHDHGIHAFVFGPDGKLYFNFGNSGGQLKDKAGKPIVDKAGNEINSSRQPYQEGMVFRCNLDGSEVETLGWNFRNNWEVCVDSFGTMWQSDNDDDGNRGVRINYVMEFGNYGYKDELTGAGWQTPRTNLEAEIPLRHWHLNDPGVVPNLLQTGAGSPTGICVYEGDLLPEIYRNQIIHCDAGPNVVRAYITQPDGAGYKAEIANVLQGARDNWFRPSDVCVAPDGSLIVADWYDPGVGGHRQGDVDRGRIFRVAPPGSTWSVPKVDVSSVEGAIAALKSPNHATRYLAWTALHKRGLEAQPAIYAAMTQEPNPRQQARLLGLLAKLPMKGRAYILGALEAKQPDLQIAALRLLRQSEWAGEVPQAVRKLVAANSTAVRREAAIALRALSATDKAPLWATLAGTYDGTDRWFLEALGIAAGDDWDACLAAYLNQNATAATTKAGRDIIWRSRAAQTPALLVKLISNSDTPMEELPRYFRALDFLTGEGKEKAVTQLAFATNVTDPQRSAIILTEALDRVLGFDINQHPQKRKVIEKVLEQTRGTVQSLSLIERFGLNDKYADVVALVQQQPDSQFAVDAAKALFGKKQVLMQALEGDDPLKVAALIRALGNASDNRAAQVLPALLDEPKTPLVVRQEAAKALGKSKQGVIQLLERAKGQKLSDDLQQAVAFALQSSTFPEFRSDIVALYPLPPSRNDQPLPPLDQLYKRRGNVDQGKVVFNTVGKCNTCHVVSGEGKEVGPNLTEIGSKLSREAMFESILYPSAGISHNYETWTVVTNDGNSISGLLVSQTPDEVQLKGVDAIVRKVAKKDIDELAKQTVSLMPADLQKTMTVEELIDVVEYIQTLKKK